MSTSNKSFLGITGWIGLLADTIAIVGFFIYPSYLNPDINLVIFVVLLYSWIALSWSVIRKNFKEGKSRERVQRRIPVIRNTLLGFGLLTGIVSGALSYISSNPYFILIQFLAFPIAYLALYWLLPVFYEEMRIFITRYGGYVSKEDLWTVSTRSGKQNFLILKNDKITVIKACRLTWQEVVPQHYLIRWKHLQGVIRYDDLVANFRVLKGETHTEN